MNSLLDPNQTHDPTDVFHELVKKLDRLSILSFSKTNKDIHALIAALVFPLQRFKFHRHFRQSVFMWRLMSEYKKLLGGIFDNVSKTCNRHGKEIEVVRFALEGCLGNVEIHVYEDSAFLEVGYGRLHKYTFSRKNTALLYYTKMLYMDQLRSIEYVTKNQMLSFREYFFVYEYEVVVRFPDWVFPGKIGFL